MMADWQFWLVAGAMVAAAALLILRPRPLRADQSSGAVALYRAQLAEVDRDIARGTLRAPDADRLRLEIARRLLEADTAQVQPVAAGGDDRAVLGGLVLAVLGAAIGGYIWLGAPSYPDVPLATRIAEAEERRAARPDQASAEAQVTLHAPLTPDADFASLMDRLRAAVAERPGDVAGLALLARNEASLGNWKAAVEAQTALIAAKAGTVTAQDHADLAELMVALAGGYVSPQAEEVLTQALQLDPTNATARYYAGLMMGQVGRYDLGFRMWQPLVNGPSDAPWMAALRLQMPDMAARAGVEVTLPMPDGLTPEAMVAQLSERLATEGGPAEDWARLIRSLLVLGENDRAEAIRAEALQVFGDSEDALSLIRAVTAP